MSSPATHHPISKATSRTFFILTVWLAAMVALPASVTATPNCPALGPLGFAMVNLLPTDRTGATRGLIGNYAGDAGNGWVLKMQGGAGNVMLLTNGGSGKGYVSWMQPVTFIGALAVLALAWQLPPSTA